MDDLFISDALSAIPGIPSTQNSSPNAAQHTLPEHGEATPASPYTGAFPGYNSADMAKKPAKRAKVQEPAAKRAKSKGRSVKQVKAEPLTLEEQKKQRRRNQIASSVQRHREKKKCLVSTLQSDLKRLTEQLETLRAERRKQMDNEMLVVYQEQAMTQRRKRKQAEETNQTLKQALFQQTAFLGGMQALMGGGGMLCSKELEFHDWIHSYTALASRDALARRKEYVAHFTQSKMDLAHKLVLKDTEMETQRLLAMGQVYSAKVRILHDGTRDFEEMPDGLEVSMMRNLFGSAQESRRAEENAADGRVIKHFSAVFLIKETPGVSLQRMQEVAFASMRSIGVYYPAAGYESRALDHVEVQDDEKGETQSSVYYTGLSSTMDPTYEVLDRSQHGEEITVEARVLCREQRSRDEGMILWDYVDEDALCPLPQDKPGQKMIRRNTCGGVLIRREPNSGMLSMRVVCVKAFCPLESPKNQPAIANGSEAEEAQRAVARRIGLQATECERLKDRCTGYIFRNVTSQLGVTF